jgi:hypothetical protein
MQICAALAPLVAPPVRQVLNALRCQLMQPALSNVRLDACTRLSTVIATIWNRRSAEYSHKQSCCLLACVQTLLAESSQADGVSSC